MRSRPNTSIFDSEPISRPLAMVALVLGCAASCWVGVAARRPFLIASAMRAENDKVSRQIMAAKLENQHLERDTLALNTDAGKEREARRLRFLKDNEVPLMILK